MTDRLGGDAERVSSPGEYRLHVRRLVALFAGLGVLEIGILSGPTVYFTEGVKPIATRWRGCTRCWAGTSSSLRRLLWY